MHVTDISIDGYGVLSSLRITGLTEGLNVLYGTNGSGKTTILHFLRGIFCGFEESARLRLLPPLKGEHPGGSVAVTSEATRCEIIRRFRPGHDDTLAFQARPQEVRPPGAGGIEGERQDLASSLRSTLSRLDPDLMRVVFAITGSEGQAVESMLRLALRDGIPLTHRGGEAHWLHGTLSDVTRERADLMTGEPPRGRLAELEQRKQELSAEIAAAQASQVREQSVWKQEVDALRQEAARLERECTWNHAELQAVESDLTELQQRMWKPVSSAPTAPIVDECEARTDPSPEWVREIERIDARIARAQQVLRDLADSRKQLSLAQADLMGNGPVRQQDTFDRQRASLSAIERRVIELHETLKQPPGSTAGAIEPAAAGGAPAPDSPTPASPPRLVRELREQVALICQNLGSQQSVHEQSRLRSERKEIDRCERELTRQIQRLRRRRDELLHDPGRTPAERLRYRTKQESRYCRCEAHPDVSTAGTASRRTADCPVHPPGEMVPFVREDGSLNRDTRGSGHESQSRGTRHHQDAARCQEWLERRDELRERWQAACRSRNEVRSRLKELEDQSFRFAEDRSVQQKRHEYASLEQRLADAREQWDSLAILQIVLQKTQQRIQVETPAEVIREASEYLKRLTDGRYHGFRFREVRKDTAHSARKNRNGAEHDVLRDCELLIATHAGTELPLHALSRGTLEQAAFSLRLALHHEYRRRGIRLPLILDDVLTDSDEQRIRNAAEILMEQPGQVLFFTCQEHLADLFESLGAFVHALPGSVRNRQIPPDVMSPREVTEAEHGQTGGAETREFHDHPVPPTAAVPDPHFRSAPSDRVQPDDPHWLQTHSPAGSVPSLGEQMARRLGALGVRCVTDLIELDPESTEIPLESLQIAAATLRQWQAEARLLVCVPDLTGRDAQLLVNSGIHSPSELAEADAADLHRRVRQVQTRTTGEQSLHWLSPEAEWPSQKAVAQWIRSGRRARSYRQAREASVRRRLHLRSGRTVRIDAPHTPRERAAGHPDGAPAPSSNEATDATAHVRLHPSSEGIHPAAVLERDWTFNLRMDSPVIDAPSIGPRTAERLERIGVMTVSDLVHRDATEIVQRLHGQRIAVETVRSWQQQAVLVCQVPDLRERDSQLLVACGITAPEQLAARTPAELLSLVGPFITSQPGRRLLRTDPAPGLDDVAGWIERARRALELRAA